MTVGIYKTREEAESAANSLKANGLPAAVLATRESTYHGVVRTWQVVVPRECAEFVGNTEKPPAN